MIDVKKSCMKILRHYGRDHQLDKWIEEVRELYEALIEFRAVYEALPEPRTEEQMAQLKKRKDHLTEEMADVMVMNTQGSMMLNNDDEIAYEIERKLNRQIFERMPMGL